MRRTGGQLGAGVRIGPFCHVGPEARLGDGVELISHVVVAGVTEIGARGRVFPFASIGHQPQDLKYRGERTSLTIGEDCLIREGVTMNPGTAGGGGHTSSARVASCSPTLMSRTTAASATTSSSPTT